VVGGGGDVGLCRGFCALFAKYKKTRIKCFVLYASQRQAKEELASQLATSQVCVLQALSGSGKSLVADEVVKEGFPGARTVESGRVSLDIDELREAIAKELRVLVLSGSSDSTYLSQYFDAAPPIVTMKCMSPAEVEAWMDAVTPPLQPQERALMRSHGLGVPLLLEHLSHRRPLTDVAAIPLCTAYLQGVVEQNALGGEERADDLKRILEQFGAMPAPESILPTLSDCEMGRFTHTPMSVLSAALITGKELPTPETLELFARYEEWLALVKDEPQFNLFIREFPDAERILEEIG
jgi:hypothetical protein